MEGLRLQKRKDPRRIYCENESCKKAAKHYCDDHNQVLCNGCFTALHVRCNCDKTGTKEDLRECLYTVQTLLRTTEKEGCRVNADFYIKGFNDELKDFTSSLDKLENELCETIKNDKTHQIGSIQNKVLNLQRVFIESRIYTELLKYKDLRKITQDNVNVGKAQLSPEELLIYKEKILKEMEEQKNMKIQTELKKAKEQIIRNSKEIVKQIEDKVEEEVRNNIHLIEKNRELTEELEKQKEEITRIKQTIENVKAKENLIKKEIEIKEREREIEIKEREIKEIENRSDASVMFKELYENHFKEKKKKRYFDTNTIC